MAFNAAGRHLTGQGARTQPTKRGVRTRYLAATITGGFHVPSPGGRTDGDSVFGQ